ncbi:MAG TPA: peptide ABC transporter substrate-binding protein [Patescibacteria group bacterium]|nr:peptide ABC transporter substrate-binding protein [Patescibacteria group bacterium]
MIRSRWSRAGAFLAVLAVAITGLVIGARATPAQAAARTDVRILVEAPSTFDPAAQSDSATASITAQLYETLTAYDASLQLQPALAASWEVAPDGRRVVFHLRPGLTFSDGTPLTAQDVVGSWLRLLDPAHPSPLVALLADVRGARAYLTGRSTDPGSVGLRASGADVEVDLERPGADFPAIVSAPIFGVVPPEAWRDGRAAFGVDAVVSGGYVVAAVTGSEITLQRNDHYWAGAAAIATVHLVLDIGGRSPVAAFEANDLDYTSISLTDAPWIAYDPQLGPQLRATPTLALTYLGIDTTKAPFDDPRVRQALGAAVDWARITTLGAFGGQVPAHSMVPPGIPGGGDGTWWPAHDPAKARQLLADAGYPDGKGLPPIYFGAGGAGIGEAIAADLERELGMHVELDLLGDQLTRLTTNPPTMWLTGWVADYVGPNDFLGVLLASDSSDNYGHWASPAFDQAIAEALGSRDAATAQAAYERAQAEVQRDVPVVPLYVGTSWALSRDGLLGAGDNGLGILRMAGMAWAP